LISYFIALINHTRCKAYFRKFSVPHPYAVQASSRPVVQSIQYPSRHLPRPSCIKAKTKLYSTLPVVGIGHCQLHTLRPRLAGPSRDLGLDGFGKVGCDFFACLSIMPHSADDLTPPRPCTVPCQRTLAPTKCGARRLYGGRVLLDFVCGCGWRGRGWGDVWMKLNSDFYVHGRRREGQEIEM
jgi:hypothetical protein